MLSGNIIFRFGWRLLVREWQKYLLAFLSLLITGITFTVVLVGVDGARTYLTDRSRELVGGDIALESGSIFDPKPIIDPLRPWIIEEDSEVELTLSIRSAQKTTTVSARALSQEYPLYGEVKLIEGIYEPLSPHDVIVEPVVLDRLGVGVGEDIFIGTVPYRIKAVILSEPDALLQGFRFAPRLIFSQAGLDRSNLNLQESRNEYEYRYRLDPSVDPTVVQGVSEVAIKKGIEVRVAGDGQSGFLRRLEIVERFFLITVLIGAVLSAVNIYANTLSLVTRLRKSFAIFLVEGASRTVLISLVLFIVGVLTVVATLIGIGFGLLLLFWLRVWLVETTNLVLPIVFSWSTMVLIVLATLATSLAAAFPAVRDLLSLKPKILLMGGSASASRNSLGVVVLLSLLSFTPLGFLAFLLLKRADQSLLIVGGTLLIFLIIVSGWEWVIRTLYHFRFKFSFFGRAIVAEKQADGIFGFVALTSLTVALSSIFSLALLERSVEYFFDQGIGATLPSAYIVDVQSDQVSQVKTVLPTVALFPNIRARLLRIDDRAIQERLQDNAESEDRELRREFNLTYRTELLSSEDIVAGTWQGSKRGQVSVEQDFARRANIQIGSSLEFFIQGVRLSSTVTSLRSADTTSGLPFFYFVFHPDDLSRFPASFFGYANISGDDLRQAESALSLIAPNVSVLDTSLIGKTVREITDLVLKLVATITVPPLLLAVLLLLSLIAATFVGRQRDLLRIQIVGATKYFVTLLYLGETVSTLFLVSLFSFGLSLGVVAILTTFVLEGVTLIWFDIRIIEIILSLGLLLSLYAMMLLKLRSKPLRQALMYEDNS